MATAVVQPTFLLKGFDSSTKISWTTDTIKIAIVTDSYTPSAAHDFWDDVVANEASGTGYTAGGITLTTPTAAISGSSAKFDADDVSWTISSAFSGRYFMIYKSTGNNATSPLVGYIDYGSTFSLSTGTIAITFSASGIVTIT